MRVADPVSVHDGDVIVVTGDVSEDEHEALYEFAARVRRRADATLLLLPAGMTLEVLPAERLTALGLARVAPATLPSEAAVLRATDPTTL